MRRRVPPWLVSIAGHAVALAALIAVAPAAKRPKPARLTQVEIVDAQPVPQVTDEPKRASEPQPVPEPLPRPHAVHHAAKAAPSPAPASSPSPSAVPDPDSDPVPAPPAPAADPGAGTGIGNGIGTATGTGNGSGTGTGNGNGNGNGKGGTGTGGGQPLDGFMAMVNAPRSKARPARLVYPKRNREQDPERLFVAVLKIDSDGYVVGAKLEHQPPGVAADRAMSAVWRFSYDPALDDAGKPIASTVEQPFMVE